MGGSVIRPHPVTQAIQEFYFVIQAILQLSTVVLLPPLMSSETTGMCYHVGIWVGWLELR